METLLPQPDALTRQLADSARPGRLDVALRNSTTTPGKLTWIWGPDGDLVWDDSQGYAVLVSVFAIRGQCRWDRTLGTLLLTLKRARRSTGSQLSAYARDGGAQCEAAELVKNFLARADLIATGRWRLRLSWTAAGKAQGQQVEV